MDSDRFYWFLMDSAGFWRFVHGENCHRFSWTLMDVDGVLMDFDGVLMAWLSSRQNPDGPWIGCTPVWFVDLRLLIEN